MAYQRSVSLVSRLVAIISPVWAFVATVPKMSTTAKGADNPAFTLYTSGKCPYAQRTWITARELGVPFDYKIIELGKDNREDWFLKLNPLGKVPTITRGDDVVYESLVANEYLVEVFPPGGEYNTPPLLPSSPAEKAQSRIIAARCNDLVTAYLGYLSNKNEEQEASKREKFEKELRMLNDWAAKGAKDGEECGWLCGEYMTLADIAYFPFLERIDATLEPFKGWSLGEIGVPALMAWMNKCRAKESIAGTLKDPTEWAELYKKFLGIDYFVRAGVVQE